MSTVSWLLVACVATLVVVKSQSSPTCRIPDGHKEGEQVGDTPEPQGGRRCQKPGLVEVVTRRCLTRYCCGTECSCLGDIHVNSSACSSVFTELSCFVEQREVREFEYVCCNGYRENSEGICENINECRQDDNTCDQGCRDTEGSYECYCGKGYKLAVDGRTCNVDPTCNNMCAHECTKVGARYVCTCRDHYVLGEDGASCYPNVKCSQWNDCEQVCTDSEKGFLCSCRSGYKLNHNGYTCDDIDECENEGVCQHECVNTVGSYRCYCDVGFQLNDTDGRSCIADSTCNGSCEHACAFVRGRYRCVCNEGYVLASNHMSCQYIGTTTSSGDQTTSKQPKPSKTSQPSVNSPSDLTTSNDADFDVTTVTTSTASISYTTSALALYMCAHALFVVLNC